MPAHATFTDLLRDRAAERPDAIAHVFLSEAAGEMAAERLTYGELDVRARGIAARLREYGVRGQPVLLLYPSGPNFLPAYVGCLYAGAIAVPAPLPGARGERLRRVTGILRDTGATVVLCDSANASDVSLWLALSGVDNTVCLATDMAGFADPDSWRPPPATSAGDLAMLQYTSGSTSDPRGVMVTHGSLLANMAVIGRAMETGPQDRIGFWLPPFHDMGLIAHLLHPLWLGSHSVQMSPESFLKRPARWLWSIGEYGVTVGGGPNFSYDLCLRRVSDAQLAELDLSSWRLALNGAEPVRAATLAAFAERFRPAGLGAVTQYPCYGLAEATLMVSGGAAGQPHVERTLDVAALERGRLADARPDATGPQLRTVVSSGLVRDDFEVRIVDSLRAVEQPPDTVGEIWVRGDSVARGYWGRPQDSAATFRASLEEYDTGRRLDGFLRTGDLGVVSDGQLYLTGRLKEMIILNGRNLFPQDIEWTVRELGPQYTRGPGVVFTVEAGTDQLVVVQETQAGPTEWDVMRELTRRVQVELGREFGVPVPNVLLVPRGTVRRTTSGKIQRALMRRLFLEGKLTGQFEVLAPEVRALVRVDELQGLGDL